MKAALARVDRLWRCTTCESLYVSPVGFAESTPAGLRCQRTWLSDEVAE